MALPFTAPYQSLWTGSGTIGLYLGAAMTGSFYIRKHIGQKVWRLLHYFTFIAYLLMSFGKLLKVNVKRHAGR